MVVIACTWYEIWHKICWFWGNLTTSHANSTSNIQIHNLIPLISSLELILMINKALLLYLLIYSAGMRVFNWTHENHDFYRKNSSYNTIMPNMSVDITLDNPNCTYQPNFSIISNNYSHSALKSWFNGQKSP